MMKIAAASLSIFLSLASLAFGFGDFSQQNAERAETIVGQEDMSNRLDKSLVNDLRGSQHEDPQDRPYVDNPKHRHTRRPTRSRTRSPTLAPTVSPTGTPTPAVPCYTACGSYNVSQNGSITVITFTDTGIIQFNSDQMSDTLLVAGGGAGGSQLQGAFEGAGGGGAGGLGHGTLNFVAGTSYTVVIGQGGSGQGMDGENSRIYGGSIAETAYGGGHGGYVAYEPGPFGGSGGSGGGSTGSDFTRVGGNATTGTGSLMYMGNAGGYGVNGMGNISTGQDGGGGGGALDAGSPMSENDPDYDGGAGYPFLVNGTPYGFYAGGGGGGGGADKFHEGFGGVGGGGDGGAYNQNGTAGVANSGGGGGGGGSPDDLTDTRPPYILYATNGGDGGSGVAIFVFYGQILSECPSP